MNIVVFTLIYYFNNITFELSLQGINKVSMLEPIEKCKFKTILKIVLMLRMKNKPVEKKHSTRHEALWTERTKGQCREKIIAFCQVRFCFIDLNWFYILSILNQRTWLFQTVVVQIYKTCFMICRIILECVAECQRIALQQSP